MSRPKQWSTDELKLGSVVSLAMDGSMIPPKEEPMTKGIRGSIVVRMAKADEPTGAPPSPGLVLKPSATNPNIQRWQATQTAPAAAPTATAAPKPTGEPVTVRAGTPPKPGFESRHRQPA